MLSILCISSKGNGEVKAARSCKHIYPPLFPPLLLFPPSLCSLLPIRAQKETTETSNGGMGGDTPPEDEPGGADDDLLADGEGELPDETEDSPDDSLRTQAVLTTAKDDSTSRPEPTVGRGSRRAGKNSRAEPEAKSVKNAESASERGLPSSQRDVAGVSNATANNTNAASVPGERQSRRSKVKDRDSAAPAGSRASRQGRSRVHASRSSETNPISPVSSVCSSTSATIRLSPMSAAVMATTGTTPTSSPRKGRKEDGWKEVGRR